MSLNFKQSSYEREEKENSDVNTIDVRQESHVFMWSWHINQRDVGGHINLLPLYNGIK